ncbi:MAG: dephospho-CoA kinase [Gemmatimonadetes bacterium]|nr:dephospho-CoA kinase [Gemmatimonadota bacterium]
MREEAMLTVGLTGNVASGKTTVAERWRRAGVPVIDADAIGHAVLADDAAVRAELVKEFGGGILDPDEEIDRRLLGERAFATSEGVERLNDIVHPPLLERLDDALSGLDERGEERAIVDAALVFEFHLNEALDRVVLVTAPRETRKVRLRRERSLPDERIEAIMAAQLSDTDKIDESDYVIVNDGTLEDLYARADAVIAALREEAESEVGAAHPQEEE